MNVLSMVNALGSEPQQRLLRERRRQPHLQPLHLRGRDGGATSAEPEARGARPTSNQFGLTTGPVDLHLRPGADAIDAGSDLSGTFTDDIDGQARSGAWDVGADEYSAASAGMRVLSGQYNGNGNDGRAIFVGFQPDVVFVKRDQGNNSGLDYFPQARTGAMAGDVTKNLSDAGGAGVATYAGGIKSLDPTGFTIGTNPAVNTNGAPFYWIALKAAPGELLVGSYTGDGTDSRSITGVGFQPDYVMLLPAGTVNPVHRSSAMPGEMTFGLDSLIHPTNAIQAMQADGFQVGTAGHANQDGMTYYYVAARAVAGRMGVGQYTGNGGVLNVDTVGFQPELAFVRRATTSRPFVYKPAATGVNADYGIFFNDYAGSTRDITQLRPLGFQVTSGPESVGSDRANDNGAAYYWVAFGSAPRDHELPLDRGHGDARRRRGERSERDPELGHGRRAERDVGEQQPRARRRDRHSLPEPADLHRGHALHGRLGRLGDTPAPDPGLRGDDTVRPHGDGPAAVREPGGLGGLHRRPRRGRLPVLPGREREPRRGRSFRGRRRLQGHPLPPLGERNGRGDAGPVHRRLDHRLDAHDHADRRRHQPAPRDAGNGRGARQPGERLERGRVPVRRPRDGRVAGGQGGQRRDRARDRRRARRRRPTSSTCATTSCTTCPATA